MTKAAVPSDTVAPWARVSSAMRRASQRSCSSTVPPACKAQRTP